MSKKLTSNRVSKLQEGVDDLLNNWDVGHGMARALGRLAKEAVLSQNHLNGTLALKTFSMPNTNKVQIGGGSHTLKGFLNIDIFPPADRKSVV